ncbi:hypothetical protein QBE52_01670 [Clostridiaceae bacterium 35-E11]
MMDSYIEKFHILETFRSNDAQNILIGSMKDNPNNMVIINILRDNKYIWSNAKESIAKSLKNLLHIEEIDNGLVVVTRFRDGESLDTYLEKRQKMSIDKKLNLLSTYLNHIVAYDSLDYYLQNILIDESEIIVEENKIDFNELMIIDEEFTGVRDFVRIAEKVGKIAKKIFLHDIQDESKKIHIPYQLLHFIEQLENPSHGYKNLNEIRRAFQNLYIYDWYMNDTKSMNGGDILLRQYRNPSKPKNGSRYIKIATGILLIAAAYYGYLHLLSNDKIIADRYREPTAYFEKIQMKNEWEFINKSIAEGEENHIVQSTWEVYKDNKIVAKYDTRDLNIDFLEPYKYKIVLKVQDENQKWSKPYFEEIEVINPTKESQEDAIKLRTATEEKLENLKMFYDENQVMKDQSRVRSGTYAIKFTKSSDDKKIKIKDLQLDKHPSLSMWVMSDHKEPVRIQVTGYYNGKRSFKKHIDHESSAPNVWELVSLHEMMGRMDEVEIVLLNDQATVWMDDIEISTYK